jgi:hypothetical protein
VSADILKGRGSNFGRCDSPDMINKGEIFGVLSRRAGERRREKAIER